MYGPMQWYSASAGGMFLDKDNCMANDDCELTLMQADDLDICGGGEVLDGDAAEGTHYRYVVTQHFPYLIQCFRGKKMHFMLLNPICENINYPLPNLKPESEKLS